MRARKPDELGEDIEFDDRDDVDDNDVCVECDELYEDCSCLYDDDDGYDDYEDEDE